MKSPKSPTLGMAVDHKRIRELGGDGAESGRIVSPRGSKGSTGRGHIKGSGGIIKANRKQTGKKDLRCYPDQQ